MRSKSPEITRLQALFNALQITPAKVAETTGISERTINNYFWNDDPIGNQLLRQLQRHYGVSIDWLLNGTGNMLLGERTERHDTQPLIPKFNEIDTNDAQDLFIIAAAAIEQALMQTGAEPGTDYNKLDLFNLAQPFVLERFKEQGVDLKFFG